MNDISIKIYNLIIILFYTKYYFVHVIWSIKFFDYVFSETLI